MNAAQFGRRETTLTVERENGEVLSFDFVVPSMAEWSAVNLMVPLPRPAEVVDPVSGTMLKLTDDASYQKAVSAALDLRLAVRVANALVESWDATLTTPTQRGQWLLEHVPGDVYNAIATWLASTVAAKEERIKARVATFQPGRDQSAEAVSRAEKNAS